MWLCNENITKNLLFNTLMEGCKANSTFTYKLYFDGTFLKNTSTINEYDILEDSLIAL